jgi:glucan phosphoethanolaminetransferase (alkaline phosphatase superfamily)
MYAAPVGVMIFWAARGQALRSIAALTLAAALIACAVAAATRRWRPFFLVQLPLSVLSVAFVAYTVSFNMPPGRTIAHVIAGASLEEVRGFVHFSQGLWLALLLGAWTACYAGFAFALPRRPIFVGRMQAASRVTVMALVPVAAFAAFDPPQLIDGMALDPIVGSALFLSGDLPRAKRELAGSRIAKLAYHASRPGGTEEVHILVIGESARRDSWSAYGYGRQTTPLLADDPDIIWLKAAMADANLTDWAVPILLTGMAPDEFSISKVRGNVFDLAKEAGYATSWLVNQDIAIGNSVGVAADFLEYPPDLQANINGRHALDEVLIPAYRRELGRGGHPRFIGIHMMGSHWEYFRRYPPSFQRFGSVEQLQSLSMVSVLVDTQSAESATVDAYDNSVSYTDWFLHELTLEAGKLGVPATLMFVPDHGEDLQLLDDGSTGHGGPSYTRHAFEIPAFVWVNEAYRKAHPDLVENLAANAGKEIRSHDVFSTEAQLMGITWPGASSARSFASDRFVPDAAMKHIAGGRLVERE